MLGELGCEDVRAKALMSMQHNYWIILALPQALELCCLSKALTRFVIL